MFANKHIQHALFSRSKFLGNNFFFQPLTKELSTIKSPSGCCSRKVTMPSTNVMASVTWLHLALLHDIFQLSGHQTNLFSLNCLLCFIFMLLKFKILSLLFTTCLYYDWSKFIKWYNLHYIERQSTNIV